MHRLFGCRARVLFVMGSRLGSDVMTEMVVENELYLFNFIVHRASAQALHISQLPKFMICSDC